ncbi:MAG: hypothetical protein H8E44_09600 [Planctomycetes bacterium]|nr:hypothetical protein [Planctomycetota bacterium]MBL7039084.1 hypothetical protein [Pirellulaceae bacterium]
MIIVTESAATLKAFIAKTSLNNLAQAFVLRMALTFIMHRGRMSCSQAAGFIASEASHRGQLTRFLARPRWQRYDFNAPLRMALLQMETGKGRFFFIIDATLSSQSGRKTQNTHSTGNHKRRPKKGRRYDIGGTGKDDLNGGKDVDILIGGFVTLSQAMLEDVRNIWTNGDTYENRVDDLTESLLIADTTVLDDGAEDTLKGDKGRDLFRQAQRLGRGQG